MDGFVPIAKTYEPNLPCVALWSLFVIFGDGRVPLCNVDFNNKYPVGDIMTSSIQEIWRSTILNKYRSIHLNREKNKISICENCNVWDEVTGEQLISPEYAEKVSISQTAI